MNPELAPTRAPGPGLVLIGYRGTGKSTVGRILADGLGRPFVDADLRIEARAGMSVARLFKDLGEAAFRDWEERIIEETAAKVPDAVFATGGGAILRETNRARLRDFGLVVWLRGSSEILASRLSSNPRGVADRPALTSAGTISEISQVLEARLPLYRELADIDVDTEGRSPWQVAEFIQQIWKSRPKP